MLEPMKNKVTVRYLIFQLEPLRVALRVHFEKQLLGTDLRALRVVIIGDGSYPNKLFLMHPYPKEPLGQLNRLHLIFSIISDKRPILLKPIKLIPDRGDVILIQRMRLGNLCFFQFP